MLGIQRSSPRLKQPRQEGYLLILVLGITLVLITLAAGVITISSAKYDKTTTDISNSNAVYTAEAGISDTIAQLNLNNSFTGYTTKKQFYSSTTKGKAEYTTSVADNGNNTLTITSTGYLSRQSTDTTPFMTRTVKAIILEGKTPVIENVIAGGAGLTMSGSFFPWFGQPTAMSKGTVYSRGKINLNGLATSIGTSTDSARVTAANIGCGPASTWPQPCASTDPPIVFGGGWFSAGTGSIYGSVCATNQTSSTSIFPGPTGTGLQQNCVAPDYGLPTFDKATFTSKAILPALPATATCPLFGVGAPVWVDGERITGDVNLSSSFSTCTATITGDVYIQGNLTIGAGAQLNVSDTLGSRRPTIVVNGNVTITSSSKGVFANSSGTPLTIISFASKDSTCSTSDTCTSISPANLYSSSIYTGTWYSAAPTYGISLADDYYGGSTNADLSGLAIYSYFGTTSYAMSGTHSLRGIGGQGVIINPGGMFNFNGGSLSVTDTSPFSWILGRTKYSLGDYQQVYN